MKDSKYVNIHSVNPWYLGTGEVDGSIKCNSIEEKNKNKYLTFASTDKNKEVLKKSTELWDEIKSLIQKIDSKSCEYGKDYMKIQFNSDDNLPLNKILNFII